MKRPKECQVCQNKEFRAEFRYKQRSPYSKVEELYDEHCTQCGNLVFGYAKIAKGVVHG